MLNAGVRRLVQDGLAFLHLLKLERTPCQPPIGSTFTLPLNGTCLDVSKTGWTQQCRYSKYEIYIICGEF
eukprot:261923-Pleurochrysis_carterae.AAC.2